MLTFNPDTHEYKWNNRRVPSVTEIIGEWIRVKGADYYVNTFDGNIIPATRFEQAGDFGRAIHKACALIISGTLDWNSLDPALILPLKQFEKWLSDFNVEIIYVEKPLYSSKYNIAGTPDLIATIQGFKDICLIDIKTGNYNFAAPQLYAYELLFREYEKYRKPIKKQILHLNKKGNRYKFHAIEDSKATAFFLSRLFQREYLYQKGNI